jgi:hypothetical protein
MVSPAFVQTYDIDFRRQSSSITSRKSGRNREEGVARGKKKAAGADTPETKALQDEIKKLEEKKKSGNATITVKHNGVVIHDNAQIKEKTGGGKDETPEGGEIQLQGHGNPVFYRNIWIVEKK